MAIHNHLEVRIFSDGIPLAEYEIQEESSGKDNDGRQGIVITRYVESKPGHNFEIEYKANKNFEFPGCDALSMSTYIDGTKSPSPRLVLEKTWETDKSVVTLDSGFSDSSTIRKYRFQALTQVESDTTLKVDDLKTLGCIIEVWPKTLRERTEWKSCSRDMTKPAPTQVSEKMLKGRLQDAVIT